MKWVEQSYTHTFKYSTQCTHMSYDHQLCTCSLSASSCDMACTCCWVTAWASDLTHLDPPTCSLACVCVKPSAGVLCTHVHAGKGSFARAVQSATRADSGLRVSFCISMSLRSADSRACDELNRSFVGNWALCHRSFQQVVTKGATRAVLLNRICNYNVKWPWKRMQSDKKAQYASNIIY